jgi:hypothetical protein
MAIIGHLMKKQLLFKSEKTIPQGIDKKDARPNDRFDYPNRRVGKTP